MKKTNFKDKDNYKLGEIIILIFLLVFGVTTIGLLLLRNFLNNSFINIFIIFNLIPLSIFGLIYIGILYGKLRVRKKELLMKKDIILDNPYIYYRELPNNYGIGISSILIDKTIENDKDIIACILSLCAKKYLKLEKDNDKYIISVLNKDYSKLFSNEVYILDSIINNKVKEISYQTWYDLCVKDSKSLGLFEDYKEDKTSNKYYSLNDKTIKIILFISIIIGLISFIVPSISNSFTKENNALLVRIISMICISFASFPLLICVSYLFLVGKNMYEDRDIIYNQQLMIKLIYTSKGINEVKKLLSFKEFLKDFGSFKFKNIEEIILWDEYLSYAIMFNLTDDILKTGYKKLVDNSSFKIDSVDNISLNNLSVNI